MEFNKLIAALRYCAVAENICPGCPQFKKDERSDGTNGCVNALLSSAADTLET